MPNVCLPQIENFESREQEAPARCRRAPSISDHTYCPDALTNSVKAA